jgi:hypothetical protein
MKISRALSIATFQCTSGSTTHLDNVHDCCGILMNVGLLCRDRICGKATIYEIIVHYLQLYIMGLTSATAYCDDQMQEIQ